MLFMKHNTIIKTIAFAILIFCIGSSQALDNDHFLPYNITSTSALHNSQKNITTFSGNVVVIQGTTKLTGDKAVIMHPKNSNTIKTMITTGTPAVYSTIPQSGKGRIYASADTITYYPQTHHALLVNNAVIIQEQNKLSGKRILYNTLTKTVISKSQGARNELIIQPRSQGQNP